MPDTATTVVRGVSQAESKLAPVKKPLDPELKRLINQQAHLLSVLSSAGIRASLEERARAMLNEGRTLEEVFEEIPRTVLPGLATPHALLRVALAQTGRRRQPELPA